MEVRIGPWAILYAEKVNNLRIERAELQASEASKEHRTALRNARILQNDYYEEEQGIVCGTGIAEWVRPFFFNISRKKTLNLIFSKLHFLTPSTNLFGN